MMWQKGEESSTLVDGYQPYYYSSINIRNNFILPCAQPCDASKMITLTWINLNVFVKSNKTLFKKLDPDDQRQILKGVSGQVTPGQFLAIMGSSGAGKSTLLNVLNRRNCANLQVKGQVLVNGQEIGTRITRVSAYVQQDDLFIGHLTVREHLIFQALLKMNKDKTYDERIQRVEEVIYELGLTNCRDSPIGIAGWSKFISGGEKKRLAFASEILTNPPLMFCDEPTSGLDALMALSVISVLKELAMNGTTIICTIHQPSSLVFELFDQLLLMADGKVAYQGAASSAKEFFERAGFQCPKNYNPSDFFIQKLSINPNKENESKERIFKICSLLESEQQNKEKDFAMDGITIPGSIRRSKYAASWFAQFQAVLWRSWLSISRDPVLTRIRIFQTTIVAIMIGTLYFQQKLDEVGVMNLNGVSFLMIIGLSFQNMNSVITVFCHERHIFLHEHADGMYGTDVYFLCKTIVEIPILTLISGTYMTIIYWMAGFNWNVHNYLFYLLTLVLVSMTSASFGYFLSCISTTSRNATSLGLALVVPLIICGGFFLNAGSVPGFMIWLKYVSWFHYCNEVLAVIQWNGIKNITCHSAVCHPDGKSVLKMLNFDKNNVPMDICMIVVLFLAFRLLAFSALAIRSHRKT